MGFVGRLRKISNNFPLQHNLQTKITLLRHAIRVSSALVQRSRIPLACSPVRLFWWPERIIYLYKTGISSLTVTCYNPSYWGGNMSNRSFWVLNRMTMASG